MMDNKIQMRILHISGYESEYIIDIDKVCSIAEDIRNNRRIYVAMKDIENIDGSPVVTCIDPIKIKQILFCFDEKVE